jgi:hypothetical protein
MHRLTIGFTSMFLTALICCALSTFSAVAQEKPWSNLLPIKEGSKWGYIDRTGTVVIKPQFDEAGEFLDGLALVRFGMKVVSSEDVNAGAGVIGEPTAGLLPTPILTGGKWGFIDTTGKLVIEAQPPLDFVGGGFYEGLSKVSTYSEGRGWLYGYIDKSGKVVIKPRFTYAYPFREGLAAVCLDIKCGFIDKTGKIAIAPKYRVTAPFSGGLGIAGFDHDAIGFVDKNGEMVIQPQFGFMGGTGFNEDLSAVAIPYGRYGYIDKQGSLVIEMKFELAFGFSEGLAAVMVNNKWGYIDRTGKTIIEPQFDEAGGFSEGMAAVRTDKGYGYIDKTGKIVIEPQFGGALPFIDGIARVLTESKWAYINKTGQFIWKPTN